MALAPDLMRATSEPGALDRLGMPPGGGGGGRDAFSYGTPDAIAEALRQWIISQVIPMRQSGFLAGLSGLQRQANASPLAILQATLPQREQAVRQSQAQNRDVSQRLGPGGGGQGRRAQGQVQNNLAQALAQLFGGVPLQARQDLFGGSMGGSVFVPPPHGQTTSVNTQTQRQAIPVSPYEIAGGIQGLIGLGRGTYNLFSGMGAGAPGGYGGGAPGFYYP